MDTWTRGPARGVAAAILTVLVLGAFGADSQPLREVPSGASPVASSTSAEGQRQRALRQAMTEWGDAGLEARIERQRQREAYPLLADKLDHQKAVLLQLVRDLIAPESSDAPDTLPERARLRAQLRDYAARIERTEQALRTPPCFPN